MGGQKQQFPGFPPGPTTNFFRFPRCINGWWHTLSPVEQGVLWYIIRHTWGYNKTTDKISLTQFQEGIKRKDGSMVDGGTGIKKRQTIIDATVGLEKRGFIKVIRKFGEINEYRLKIVQEMGDNSYREKLPIVTESNYPIVTESNSQKKMLQKKIKQKIINKDDKSSSNVAHFISKFRPVNPSYARLFSNKTQRFAMERLLKQWGGQKIEEVLNILPLIFGQLYAPRITTPYHLEAKFGDLMSYLKQKSARGQKYRDLSKV